MRTLNGKHYYDKSDCKQIYTIANSCLYDPSLLHIQKTDFQLSFDFTFLYKCTDDDLTCIKDGINRLNNTLKWEFSSETALKLSTIEKCFLSLRSPASNRISFDLYHSFSAEKQSTDNMLFLKNWLNDIGSEIFYYMFD